MNKPQKFKAIITKKEWISKKVLEVTIKPQEPSRLAFTAGQTMMIYIAPGINRSMSIASSCKNEEEIVLCWDVSPMGPGAHWILDRRAGDEMQFMAPLGVFVFDVESANTAYFLATGTGIAPFRSFLDSYANDNILKETHLYWGLRHEEDMFWNDLFLSYQEKYSHIHYNLSLSQPAESWTGLKGHITDHVLPNINVQADYYLCGSGAMVDEIYKGLLHNGVPEKQIKRELFFT